MSDIYRATLPSRSGNEGWIGLEPSGKTYHVIVPVDPQIARGVMACNRPTDGTPFGGYMGWLYFRCEPFNVDDEQAEEQKRKLAAKENAFDLVEFASGHGIQISVIEDLPDDQPSHITGNHVSCHKKTGQINRPRLKLEKISSASAIKCDECSAYWENLTRLLADPSVTFYRYKANTTDFRKGYFIFRHSCGGVIEIGVAKLGRSRYAGKSLAGSHACPGFCYFDTSVSECSAACEGSVFRRIARSLKTR